MKNGFSLIELIAVLLLVGVLALSATVSLLPVAEAFAQARENATSAQKARLAMNRMVREFTTITNVLSSGQARLSYEFLDPAGAMQQHDILWAGTPGDPLLLNGIPLSDDVMDFELNYYSAMGGTPQSSWNTGSELIAITLQSTAGGGRYTAYVTPRNILD